MSKLICYALFDGGAQPFEMDAYVRGFYFNARMNNLIYPDWRTHLEVDFVVYEKYKELFDWLVSYNNLDLHINRITPPLCEGMLWRMKPLFTIDVSHILCRDTDALTTYKEAQAVQEWLESRDCFFHAMNDNPAHGGLMGGMVGFDSSTFKAVTDYYTWEDMIKGKDLSRRGSDQDFLNKILPLLSPSLMMHAFQGSGCRALHQYSACQVIPPQVDPRLWESNLTCRHIGSAGVV